MEKSRDAFRTISEVAEHLDTPAHVLRFWESRFPQVRPVKRAGGRRYYRPTDVALLAGIKRLLHTDGLTIRGVQKVLREQGIRHVMALAGDISFEDDAAPTAEAAVPTASVTADTSPKAPPDAPAAEAGVLILGAATAIRVEPPPEAEPAPLPLWEARSEDRPEPAVAPVEAAPATPAPHADEEEAQVFSHAWLASRLRAMAPGSLRESAAEVEDISARLTALRDRMARVARSQGH